MNSHDGVAEALPIFRSTIGQRGGTDDRAQLLYRANPVRVVAARDHAKPPSRVSSRLIAVPGSTRQRGVADAGELLRDLPESLRGRGVP